MALSRTCMRFISKTTHYKAVKMVFWSADLLGSMHAARLPPATKIKQFFSFFLLKIRKHEQLLLQERKDIKSTLHSYHFMLALNKYRVYVLFLNSFTFSFNILCD